jgi:SRSO17 transposase
MAAGVDLGCAQQFQHFISNSPWPRDAVVAQIEQDANRLLGGGPDSCLIIDESSLAKQGGRSVGVARQWSGRQSKIDNCQVAMASRQHASCRRCASGRPPRPEQAPKGGRTQP